MLRDDVLIPSCGKGNSRLHQVPQDQSPTLPSYKITYRSHSGPSVFLTRAYSCKS